MTHWLKSLRDLQAKCIPVIAVAVASTRGSVPREAGTRMLVTADEIHGTIGGGHLEHKAIAIARDILRTEGNAHSLHRFPLGASLGQCCGGLVNLLFEPVAAGVTWVNDLLAAEAAGHAAIAFTPVRGDGGKLIVTAAGHSGKLPSAGITDEAISLAREHLTPVDLDKPAQPSRLITLNGEQYFLESLPVSHFNIVLFGAGHVGRALIKILADLPCHVSWVDSRDEEFPVVVPGNVEKCISDAPADDVAAVPAGSYFIVMTHNHQLDQLICDQILRRGDHAYFGVIGSITKRRQFERRLLARGINAQALAGMICPIGTAGLTSKEPMAIALSVALELLRHHEAITSRPGKDLVMGNMATTSPINLKMLR